VGHWQYIDVIGRPVAYGIGFLVLILVAFASEVADSIVRVAHEGGHMLVALISGHRVTGFEMTEPRGGQVTGSGKTTYKGRIGWVSEIFNSFAGYATPPLVGLAGAHMIASGNSWGVLTAGVVLLLAVLLIPKINPLALTFTVLLLVGILWALIAGKASVQAALAVGLVWLMLIGGLRMIVIRNTESGDVEDLVKLTWIPAFVWFVAWLVVGVFCLWVGGRVLLGYA
jgi:hypothetical protein